MAMVEAMALISGRGKKQLLNHLVHYGNALIYLTFCDDEGGIKQKMPSSTRRIRI
jgi:hypothetical protein